MTTRKNSYFDPDRGKLTTFSMNIWEDQLKWLKELAAHNEMTLSMLLRWLFDQMKPKEDGV